MSVENITIEELNDYGLDGWMAVSMIRNHSRSHCSKFYCGNCGTCGWSQETWTGLLQRNISANTKEE